MTEMKKIALVALALLTIPCGLAMAAREDNDPYASDALRSKETRDCRSSKACVNRANREHEMRMKSMGVDPRAHSRNNLSGEDMETIRKAVRREQENSW